MTAEWDDPGTQAEPITAKSIRALFEREIQYQPTAPLELSPQQWKQIPQMREADNADPMPKAPEGFDACRTMGGSMSLFSALPPGSVQTSHLVPSDGWGGSTVCGLTRHGPDADIPGWSMNGGVSGRNVRQIKCFDCWEKDSQ